jgi:hypothetical protein
MAATMERLVEYRTHNAQFCKRMLDFLSIMFTAQVRSVCVFERRSYPLLQSRILLGDGDGLKVISGLPNVLPHRDMETYLGRYSGLMLYLREMDENVYAKLCAVSGRRLLSINVVFKGHSLRRPISRRPVICITSRSMLSLPPMRA